MFPTTLAAIEGRIQKIDPISYAATRNYETGAVTKLSPYISRGVISTKYVFKYIQSLELPWPQIEKLVQELAWRDYWQQVWIVKGDAIDEDLRRQQQVVLHHKIPTAILHHRTGIEAVDQAIQTLYKTGYMHNHMRMYVASIACNIARSHWLHPAQWMYSHLLDGDWASNALSWQWVAGTNANKKYYANQENINRFFNSDQQGTFLDVAYEAFDNFKLPEELEEIASTIYEMSLPQVPEVNFENKKTLIYNYYNLDPKWHAADNVQRILLLEPSFFSKYPVQQKCIDFILQLANNIPDIKLFVGEFHALEKQLMGNLIIYKEHPCNRHYNGIQEERDWMFNVTGYYPSFFKFWKACKKEIDQ